MILAVLPLTLLCLLVACWCLQDIARARLEPRLGGPQLAAPPGAARADGPLVSVLIPARDEAARIGACLDGLAQQSYRSFELIVVDDGSTDGTVEVARAYADRIPGLQVVAGAPLAAGWAGKPWACWQAALRAGGEWLLFLDADVAPGPGLLAALVARATAARLDLLTLMPLLRLGSPAERLVLPAFMSLLYGLYPLERVGDPASPVAFTNGQCLLVRRPAYQALGGHRAVQGSILEDTQLGQIAKAAGLRMMAAAAPDLIAVRMYTGWRSLAEGLSKNAVAGFQSGGGRSALVGARQALIAFLPFALLIMAVCGAGTQTPVETQNFASLPVASLRGIASLPVAPLQAALIVHGVALAAIGLGTYAWLAWWRYRLAAGWGLLYPLGLAIYFGLAGVALVRLRTGRGVQWKGRVFR